jgi:hypothetical protein
MKKLLFFMSMALLTIKGFAQIPTNGLVSYFGFENNINGSAPSHNFANGTSSNVTFATGKYGQGAVFTGNETLVNQTIAGSISGVYSIAWWEFRPATGTPSNLSTSFELGETNYYRFATSSGCTAPAVANSYQFGFLEGFTTFRCMTLQPQAAMAGTWVHHAIVHSGTQIWYYRDGVVNVNGLILGSAGIVFNTNKLTLGGGTNSNVINSAKSMIGTLDEIYVYNRALSAGEVKTIADNGVATGSIAEYNFNNTTNNVNGTNPFGTNAGTSFVSDRNNNPTGAFNINLTGSNATIPNLPYANNARTISVWAKMNTFAGGSFNYLYVYGNSTNYNGTIVSDTEIKQFGNGANGTHTQAIATAANDWNHYVFVYANGISRIYKNGVYVGGAVKSWNTINNANIFRLGLTETGGNGGSGVFNGAVDDLKFFDRELGLTEIANLYNYNALASAPLISNTSVGAVADNVASINYTVNANLATATTVISYGTSANSMTSQQSGTSITGNTAVTNSTQLVGLMQGTIYFYQVSATNSQGIVVSTTGTFTTTSVQPTISNVNAIYLTNTSHNINYTVIANNSPTTTVVKYGLSAASMTNVVNGIAATGTTNTAATVPLNGLTPGATYFYKVEATNIFGTSMSTTQSFKSQDPALVAEYNFDGTTNNIFGSAPFTFFPSHSYVTDRNNVANKAYFTNNVGTTATITELPYGNSPRSVSVWVKLNTFNPSGFNYIYLYGSNTNYNGATYNAFNSSHLGNGGSETAMVANTANTWHHFVFTYNGSLSRIYKNGLLISTSNTNLNWNTLNNSDLFRLGITEGGSGGIFNGAIDDLKIYNRALDQADVTSLFSSNAITLSAVPTVSTTQTFCSASTVANLTATGTNIKWYNVATGGNALAATSTLITATYYVTQNTAGLSESLRVPVAVSAGTTPAAPASSNIQEICGSGTVSQLTAIGTNIKWYNVSAGGSPLASSASLVTGDYYVSQSAGACESARTLVSVTVSTVAAPTAAAQSFCNQNPTVSLLNPSNAGIKWYNVASGGSALSYTSSLTTGNYYVSQTTGTCESARTLVVVTVNNVAVPTSQSQSFCNSGTVANLVATGTNLKWYNVATGGTTLATTTLLTTGNYYVSQTTGTCESARTLVAVTVSAVAAPTAATTQSFCNSGTVGNLVATGTDLKWYDVATLGSPLAASSTLSTGTYYVTQSNNTCESTRTMVAVTLTSVAAPIGNVAQSYVTGATVASLTATGTTIVWFDSAANANANTSPLATNTILTNNTTYYAMQTVNGCRSTAPLAVNVSLTLSNTDFNKNLKASIYPNPAADNFTIQIENEIKSVEVYSLQGQKVLTDNKKQINVSGLSKGMYMVRIEDENGGIATQKLVKE